MVGAGVVVGVGGIGVGGVGGVVVVVEVRGCQPTRFDLHQVPIVYGMSRDCRLPFSADGGGGMVWN